MKHQLEFKGFEPTDEIRRLIEGRIAHFHQIARGLRGDSLFLRCAVEGVSAHKLFRVSVTLEVPQKALAAKEEAHDPETAIRSAFQEIERQLEAYKSAIRGEHWWKRVERRRELERRKTGKTRIGGVEDPQWFFPLVEPHMDALRNIAGHVLRYVEARGDLPQNALELDDVVDAALARAYDKFAGEHVPENIRSRLIRFALDEIKAAVKRFKTERERTVAIEEDIPETSPTEEVSTLGDEILDFYQPDEDLKVEDVVPDIELPRPDEIAVTEELRRCVRETLSELPRDERRALTLRYIIGLRGSELAESLRKPKEEVRRLLDDARTHLRQKLVASGCTPKTSGPAPSVI
jgi:RNA polymerase sigma factor (sigma-70 family)